MTSAFKSYNDAAVSSEVGGFFSPIPLLCVLVSRGRLFDVFVSELVIVGHSSFVDEAPIISVIFTFPPRLMNSGWIFDATT
jgi:hypothetical protein